MKFLGKALAALLAVAVLISLVPFVLAAPVSYQKE